MTHYVSLANEHMIPVVFDVEAGSRQRAAEIVAQALALSDDAPLRSAFDATNREHPDSFLESWWFPEADDKPVDRNDRDRMRLMPARAEEEAWFRADECSRLAEMLEESPHHEDAAPLVAFLRKRAEDHLG